MSTNTTYCKTPKGYHDGFCAYFIGNITEAKRQEKKIKKELKEKYYVGGFAPLKVLRRGCSFFVFFEKRYI